jgi:minor extracellular serine protease Vpr
MRLLLHFRAVLLLLALAVCAAAQRRPATVVLRAPSLVEHLDATEPQIAVGGEAARAAHIRQRMLSAEGGQYRQSLRQAKAPLADSLRRRGAVVNTQTETILNALTIEAVDGDLVWLRAQPEVKSAVYALEIRAALDAATTLIGAPQVWSQIGGSSQTGRGIKVAMVDSGIDITNPMFSDNGFTAPAGFPMSDSAADAAYTNNKVIVAKNYVICSQDSQCNPQFDNSAVDGYGHGSHTSSIVGGNCVTSPFGTSICGVAPGAFLGNYKVFDSTNHYSNSNWVLSAMDAAVADGMDVINFSGGSSATTLGEQPASQLLYTPIHNAVAAGVVVAICAGNCGPGGSTSECNRFGDATIWTPAIEPDAISVGASTNAHTIGYPLTVVAPVAPANLQTIGFLPGSAPAQTSVTGPAIISDVVHLDSSRLACNPLPAGSLTGGIVLVLRGICAFTVKIANAAAAGAIGVVVYDNLSEPLDSFGISTPGASIPSAAITALDGANLIAFLAAHPGVVQITLGPTQGFVPQFADQISNYSSRGPNTDYSIKPDVVAPGDVYAATQTLNSATGTLYNASHFNYSSGTSFATPQVAAGAAILKQQRPSLTASDIKSALVNTATPVSSTLDGAPAGVMQTGAGRLNLAAALNATLTANPVSLSFGLINATGNFNQSLPVTLKGVGSQAETFDISVNPLVSDPNVHVTTNAKSVAPGPGQTVTLQLNVTTSAVVAGVFEGFVNVVGQSGATSLRIPYWVMFGTPALPPGGLVDAAAFAPAVAPGGIVPLFGTDLGGDPASAAMLPLPSDIGHTTVLVSQTVSGTTTTTAAPLFYTSSGQVSLQLPFTLAAGDAAQILSAVAGVDSNTLTFVAADAAPQIFAAPSGGATIGVVVHGLTGALVTAASPAAAGEVVVIYCNGLGAVTPVVNSGQPSPANPLSITASTTTATIGGQPASVQFSGLTPGSVGLYQVNAVIPTGLGSGAQPVTISVAGATSKSVTTYIQ